MRKFLPVFTRNIMRNTYKKKLKGIIVSHAGNKTAVVEVQRYYKHFLFKKYIKRSKRYKAHDEKNEYAAGDVVQIQESRPISREKHWIIISKLNSHHI